MGGKGVGGSQCKLLRKTVNINDYDCNLTFTLEDHAHDPKGTMVNYSTKDMTT